MVEDEKFFAWLDGELPADEAARVETEVAADPRLSLLAEEHRKMTGGLRGAFGEVETQPVPERLRKRWARGAGRSSIWPKLANAARIASRLRSGSRWARWRRPWRSGIVTGNLLTGRSVEPDRG